MSAHATERPAAKSNPKLKLKLKKAPKAAPKKGAKGAKGAKGKRQKEEPVEVTPDLLSGVALFRCLNKTLVGRLAPRVSHLDLGRGEALFSGAPTPDDAESPVFVILDGDVNISRTQAGGSKEIVNYLTAGDTYVQKLFAGDKTESIVLTAMCPVKALRLKYQDVNYMLKKDERFRDDFAASIRRVTWRQEDSFEGEFKRQVAQFFVEERLTFARRVKLRRMDLCIECDACYDACAERHGTDRLGPSEVKYGLTEVPANCHNCVVPECVDKCKFGMISVHPETREIVISDDCTGCTMCSRGCSFGSIRMHSLADLDVDRYFPNRSPAAKGKNIAQKCDNCAGYEDQACISACPAGALFQVDGAELFDAWQQFTVHQRGLVGAAGSPERVAAWWRRGFFAFTLVNTLILAWESFGRLMWPNLTFTQLGFEAGLIANGLDPVRPFFPGDFYSHAVGYIGGGALVATQFYRLGKWLAPRLGSVQVWMESHIWLGILGGIYGFFHTAFVFNGLISVAAFVTMVVAIITGIVGRYILFLVPRSQAGQQLAADQIQAELGALDRVLEELFEQSSKSHTMMKRIATIIAGVSDQDALAKKQAAEKAQEQEDAAGTSKKTRLFGGLMRLFGEDLELRRRIDKLAAELEDRQGVRRERAGEMLALIREKARLDRSVRRHALLGRILKRYRIVHLVASNVMFGALLLHIVISLVFRVGN